MVNEHDIDILARTIFGEARGESTAGKKAIACVVMNRYKAKKWFSGETIAETCQFCVKGSKYHQFSCWNDDDPNKARITNATYTELAEYRDIARKFIDGTYKDFLMGACHYHTVGLNPAWAKGKKADFQIGHHLFYCGIN